MVRPKGIHSTTAFERDSSVDSSTASITPQMNRPAPFPDKFEEAAAPVRQTGRRPAEVVHRVL